MYSLKTKCIGATSGKPYIKSIVGGKDNSLEGRQVRPGCTGLNCLFRLLMGLIGWHHTRLHRRVRVFGGQGLLCYQRPGTSGFHG